ncbi:MAG: tryptophan--tRNA ligase [Bacilli bacterium]
MERILTGIKPTGKLTLGNYIGVLKNLKKLQEEGEFFVFVADLHALTLPIDPNELRQNSIDIACLYLACGLDKNKSVMFLQSDVSTHAEANTILQNYLYMGELSRMTQFKDKSSKMNQSSIGLGLFAYPVLMSGDIVLYDADIVPVGDDQVQHVELTRDLVHRFNNRYGEVLKMPKTRINKVGARIMSLSDPTKKMSKSDPKGDIFLLEDLKSVRKKIMSAVTDSGCEIIYDEENKPGISNLLTIYASLKDITIEDAVKHFEGYRYGEFKKEIADLVVSTLENIQQKYQEILESKEYLEVLKDGAKKAREISNKTLQRIKTAVGLLNVE